ncbi:hypothetical protein B0T24DRAFT_592681 [Lasiosphaeria ovina]|uniref:Uncharacterized protein n=1 Tax=Lasiosphaeria ovina TaxID=92902 RepID=A0AAE0KIW0_9PEZI|nr:hypothetical protein B0T24DRAFT_592681 [Lasiosphaeria ovina]
MGHISHWDQHSQLSEVQDNFIGWSIWDSTLFGHIQVPHIRSVGKSFAPVLPRRLIVDRVLGLVHPSSPSGVPPNGIPRYLRFLQLIKNGFTNGRESVYVPTLDIDLYCLTYIGADIKHDDKISGADRSVCQDKTAQLWALKDGESYYDPANAAKTAEIRRRRATWELNKTELASVEAAVTAGKRGQTELEMYHQNLQIVSNMHSSTATKMTTLISRLQTMKADQDRLHRPTLELLGFQWHVPWKRRTLRALEADQGVVEDILDRTRQQETGFRNELAAAEQRIAVCQAKVDEAFAALQKSPLYGKDTKPTLLKAEMDIWPLDGQEMWERPRRQYQENPYDGGSWYSIVPSEAHTQLPFLPNKPKYVPPRAKTPPSYSYSGSGYSGQNTTSSYVASRSSGYQSGSYSNSQSTGRYGRTSYGGSSYRRVDSAGADNSNSNA